MNIRKIIKEEIGDFDTVTKVSKNGKPLTMYHGGSFSDGEFRGNGWFTTSKVDAIYYANQNDGVITKANLIIKNPLYCGDIKHLNIPISNDILTSVKKRGIPYCLNVENGIITFIEPNNGVLIASDLGRDGVIVIHDNEIIDAVIFSSKQIVKI